MTREELRDYVEEQRNLDRIPYHVYSTLIDGIDTLEQDTNEKLDKLRDEIDLKTRVQVKHYTNTDAVIDAVLDVIDKHKTGMEDAK